MFVDDIKNKKWRVAENLEIDYCDVQSIRSEEQEFQLNVLRKKFAEGREGEVYCTCQKFLTILSKSELFTVEKAVLVKNSPRKGFILAVGGFFHETSFLTVRKMKKALSELHKSKLMKTQFQKR